MIRLACLSLLPALVLAGDGEPRDLDWLAGCWTTPDRNAQEVWVVDDNGDLAGFGVALEEQRVAFYEVLYIRRGAEGRWIYTAHPSGQAAASFTAAEVGPQAVRFTNPDHDYPQEIRYRREGDTLLARISLLEGVNPNHFDKVACE